MLRNSKIGTFVLGFAALVLIGVCVAPADDSPAHAATKAQLAQFDKGPRTIDVSSYPEKLQDYYQIFSQKCSQCHKLSRPINCNYVLPEQWSRYIKRMMYKPGSNIGRSDAKKIYDFLVYDSSVRKKKKLDKALQSLSPAERAAQQKKINEVVNKFK